MNRRRPLRVAAALGALLALSGTACTVATNHPDQYDLTTEANVLDGYVRHQLPDPGDEPLITADDDELQISDEVPSDALAVARCIYDGITDEETGIRFSDWDRLDNELADHPQEIADRVEEDGRDLNDVDRAFLRLQEIEADCGLPE